MHCYKYDDADVTNFLEKIIKEINNDNPKYSNIALQNFYHNKCK